MIGKLAAVAALLITTVIAVVAPVAAAPAGLNGDGGDGSSDYANCMITFTHTDGNGNGQIDPGETLNVSGTGLQPNFNTDIFYDFGEGDQADIGNVTTNGSGAFGPVPVVVPGTATAGSHTLTVPGGDGALCRTTFTVGGGGSTTGGTAGGSTGTTGTTGTTGSTGTTGTTGSTGTTGTGTTGGTTDGDDGPSVSDTELNLSVDSVPCEETFTASINGALPGSTVTFARFSVRVPVGDVVADDNGFASIQVMFPADTVAGKHRVQATGTDVNGNSFESNATVEATEGCAIGAGGQTPDGGAPLPQTGNDPEPLVIIGAIAIMAGIAFVLVARRRRRVSA